MPMIPVQLSEIEVGPHFITVYGTGGTEINQLAEKMYHAFMRKRPELKAIQQKSLAHEKDDPKVYHPLGQPNELGKRFSRHFHIRYGYMPTEQDVQEIKALLKKFCRYGELDHTALKDPDYPEMNWDNHTEYLNWIEKVKSGRI